MYIFSAFHGTKEQSPEKQKYIQVYKRQIVMALLTLLYNYNMFLYYYMYHAFNKHRMLVDCCLFYGSHNYNLLPFSCKFGVTYVLYI